MPRPVAVEPAYRGVVIGVSLLAGHGAPKTYGAQWIDFFENSAATFIESAPLSEAVRAKVCRANAERILRL